MNLKIKALTTLTLLGILVSFIGFSQNTNVLIEPKDAFELLTSDGTKFIDIQKPEAFAESHLEGAINIWRSDFTDNSVPYNGVMATKTQIEDLFGDLGISNEDKLVIYDKNGLCEAARLWWILNSYNFSNINLINGGLHAWEMEKLPVTTEVKSFAKTNFKFPEGLNTSIMASKDEVLAAINDENTIILDTRSTEEFEGETQKDGAFKAGRIPASILNDWANCINYNEDKKVKSVEELKNQFASLGITPDKKVITYCHSGVRSAHTTFILTQILGFENVKNYDGSWVEWSYFKELPTETGILATQNAGSQLAEATESIAQNTNLWNEVKNSWIGFADYVWREITFQVQPWYVNYFWWLIVLSLVVWGLEVMFPWRKDQPIVRKDFWLDVFYMFFNFYIFKIVIFAAFSTGTEEIFKSLVGRDLKSFALIDMGTMPQWAQLLVFFIATDFIQWFTHVMLHRFDFFWKFHKVHHSVEQMGFAAHLRYHWMENMFYTPMKYAAVMLIGGFTPEQAYIVFYIAIAIGHLNHANIHITYGPLKYVFNNPVMHLWHHVYSLPEGRTHGINFGISLSIWDYIFRTASIPKDDANIKLGFPGLDKFPKSFGSQLFYGFKKGDD